MTSATRTISSSCATSSRCLPSRTWKYYSNWTRKTSFAITTSPRILSSSLPVSSRMSATNSVAILHSNSSVHLTQLHSPFCWLLFLSSHSSHHAKRHFSASYPVTPLINNSIRHPELSTRYTAYQPYATMLCITTFLQCIHNNNICS